MEISRHTEEKDVPDPPDPSATDTSPPEGVTTSVPGAQDATARSTRNWEKVIPEELRSPPQWVVHRDDKVPHNPKTGEWAKAGVPETWGTFEEAVAALKSGKYDGIGFEFSEEDDFCGVDLDHCIREDGTLEPWAEEIVRRLNSYTEFSPSGEGLHIILRGKVPEGGNRHDNVEMYSERRYFTVTGNPVLRFAGNN